MSQHDLSIANQTFSATRTDLNNALQALGSLQAGTTAPSTTYAHQLWLDTSNNTLKLRNADDDAWIEVLDVNQTDDVVELVSIVKGPNGSASAPTFSFDSDTNTGAYRSGADEFSISVGGDQTIRVASDTLEVVAGAPVINVKDDDNTGSSVTGSIKYLGSDDAVGAELKYESSTLKVNIGSTTVASFSSTEASTMPVGAVIQFAGTTPTGWLDCDGSAVSRTTYANLFAVTGTTYGSGDGSTTFNVPNISDDGSVGHIIKT